MHPTFTSAVANTRLYGELVLHFTILLEQRMLCELYVRIESRWIPDEVTLYFTVRSQRTNKSEYVRLDAFRDRALNYRGTNPLRQRGGMPWCSLNARAHANTRTNARAHSVTISMQLCTNLSPPPFVLHAPYVLYNFTVLHTAVILHSPTTASTGQPNVLITILFSHSPTRCSSFNATDRFQY
jgi:hypothetical protein